MMIVTEVIEQIDKLPSKEQDRVFAFLAEKVITRREGDSKRWLGKKLPFAEACDVVFRENRELLPG
jgi:hypothetical protein